MNKKLKDLIDLCRKEYKSWKPVYCGPLKSYVYFNMKGFNHLRFSADNRARNPDVVLNRVRLLEFVPEILRSAKVIEGYRYRKIWNTEYWSFVATVHNQQHPIRVVVRRVGNGKIHFLSVMKKEKSLQK
ncbi:MAG: hypothetical protein JWM39_699 [Parcubacteria group bacterium]|nr:hypothetical protein [Parcubacteria group bacterium]